VYVLGHAAHLEPAQKIIIAVPGGTCRAYVGRERVISLTAWGIAHIRAVGKGRITLSATADCGRDATFSTSPRRPTPYRPVTLWCRGAIQDEGGSAREGATGARPEACASGWLGPRGEVAGWQGDFSPEVDVCIILSMDLFFKFDGLAGRVVRVLRVDRGVAEGDLAQGGPGGQCQEVLAKLWLTHIQIS